jgi:ABC-type phosphate transport system auxiliary subunit
VALAQDAGTKKVDIDVNTKGDAWYASPWVWVVGAAVFILLLVALTRGSGRRAD